tara:strand:+ start:198 stop:533 length:336 start_codon:yes stop_codon:yes gene_type:complete
MKSMYKKIGKDMRPIKYVTSADAVNIINSQGGKFHSVTFVKKNGDLRLMNCRTGVVKHLKGGTLKYNRSDKGLIGTYDIAAKGYRSINVNTIVSISAGGSDYVVRPEVRVG